MNISESFCLILKYSCIYADNWRKQFFILNFFFSQLVVFTEKPNTSFNWSCKLNISVKEAHASSSSSNSSGTNAGNEVSTSQRANAPNTSTTPYTSQKNRKLVPRTRGENEDRQNK